MDSYWIVLIALSWSFFLLIQFERITDDLRLKKFSIPFVARAVVAIIWSATYPVSEPLRRLSLWWNLRKTIE